MFKVTLLVLEAAASKPSYPRYPRYQVEPGNEKRAGSSALLRFPP
jgi:hypothetical protein